MPATNTRCDQILTLIDRCLAEIEADGPQATALSSGATARRSARNAGHRERRPQRPTGTWRC
jgi:hypothetical protein